MPNLALKMPKILPWHQKNSHTEINVQWIQSKVTRSHRDLIPQVLPRIPQVQPQESTRNPPIPQYPRSVLTDKDTSEASHQGSFACQKISWCPRDAFPMGQVNKLTQFQWSFMIFDFWVPCYFLLGSCPGCSIQGTCHDSSKNKLQVEWEYNTPCFCTCFEFGPEMVEWFSMSLASSI